MNANLRKMNAELDPGLFFDLVHLMRANELQICRLRAISNGWFTLADLLQDEIDERTRL